jgi:hypothetical protein
MTANDTVGHVISCIIDIPLYSNPTPDPDGKYYKVGTMFAGTTSEIASASFEAGHVWFCVDGGYLQYSNQHTDAYTLDGAPLTIDLTGSSQQQAAIDNRGVGGDLVASVTDMLPSGVTDWFSNLEGIAKKGVIAVAVALGFYIVFKIVKSFK